MRFACAAAFLAACPVLMGVFSSGSASLIGPYRAFSKTLLGALSTVLGIFPVAVWDFAIVALAILAAVTLVRRIARRRAVLPWVSKVCVALAGVLLVFVSGWALNHYAPPLAGELGLDVARYTTDTLADASAHYLAQAATRAAEVPRDENSAVASQDFFAMARIAGASYGMLEDVFPIFKGSHAPVKALVLFGEPLLYSGHVGIFFAPSAEACVPLNCAPADLPFTLCHEAAHRLAIASEEEANFAAIMACTASEDVRFSYSGYLNAFAYCQNALAQADPDRAAAVIQSVSAEGLEEGVALVVADRDATYRHYLPYEGPTKEAGRQANDTYLKTFGEEEGVRSYGLVVDYLVAWEKWDEAP